MDSVRSNNRVPLRDEHSVEPRVLLGSGTGANKNSPARDTPAVQALSQRVIKQPDSKRTKILPEDLAAFDREMLQAHENGGLTYDEANKIVKRYSNNGKELSYIPLKKHFDRLGITAKKKKRASTKAKSATKTSTGRRSARPRLKISEANEKTILTKARPLASKGTLTTERLNRIIYGTQGSSFENKAQVESYAQKQELRLRESSEHAFDIETFVDVTHREYPRNDAAKEFLVAAGVMRPGMIVAPNLTIPEGILEKLISAEPHDIDHLSVDKKIQFLRNIIKDAFDNPEHPLRDQATVNLFIENIRKLPEDDPNAW